MRSYGRWAAVTICGSLLVVQVRAACVHACVQRASCFGRCAGHVFVKVSRLASIALGSSLLVVMVSVARQPMCLTMDV